LIRRCCLIHLKNSSTCQRLVYNAAMVRAGTVVLLVRKTRVLHDTGALKRMGTLSSTVTSCRLPSLRWMVRPRGVRFDRLGCDGERAIDRLP